MHGTVKDIFVNREMDDEECDNTVMMVISVIVVMNVLQIFIVN